MQASWDNIKSVFTVSAQKVIGYKKNERKEWISENTWKKIEERKELIFCQTKRS